MKIKMTNLYPKQNCHKCGRGHWYIESVPLTWACATCGNLIYYTYGVLKQQIDIKMQSSDDFVYSKDRRTILPKKNESIRRIKFRDKVSGK